MNIGQLYQFVNFELNKYQSGSFSPDEFNTVLQATYLDVLKIKLGLPEDYQYATKMSSGAISRQAYQNSQMITDDISNFLFTVSVNRVGRWFPYPADYVLFSGAEYDQITNVNGGQPIVQSQYIEDVTDAEKKFRKPNAIIPPTMQYPIIAFEASGLNVFPVDIQTIRLTYIRKPLVPVFGYTIDPLTGDVIYDPATSVQLEYKEILHNDYANMILKYIGLNIRDADAVNFGNERQIKGQ